MVWCARCLLQPRTHAWMLALPCPCRWCVQYGLLPREEAEAWVLEQAQVRYARAVGGTAGNEHALFLCAMSAAQHSRHSTRCLASQPGH